MQDKMSRARRLEQRIGLFCTDYWNADGSIRKPTEEESREEGIEVRGISSLVDALTPEQMDLRSRGG